MDYDNVLIADLAILSMHLLAVFVIFNKYMFITIGIIRIPRLVLHLVQLKTSNEERKAKLMVWLHNFRLISLIAFPICSVLVQLAIIFKMFCNKY